MANDGDFTMKKQVARAPKKEGVSVVATLLEKDGRSYVDIRERVDEPKEGWDGWTKRGISMPVETFIAIAKDAAAALNGS